LCEIAGVGFCDRQISCGNYRSDIGGRVVAVVLSPPPDTVALGVTLAPAFAATVTVTVIGS